MRVSGAIHITGDVEGERVFMTYNKSKSKPAKPTGTGETDGWSAANQDGAVWMSMKLATDITEEEWSEPMKITGDGAMNVFIDNAAHTVPADEYGNVTSFTGSGCVIKVLDGINELIFNTSQTLIAGHWWISSIDLNPPAALSVGTPSGNNTTSCVIYNHNWMSQSEDVVTIKFFITAIKSDGTYVYLSVVQTITKANKGAKGDTGIPGYQGPIPYPAGAWNSSTTYTRTNLKVPYVIYNGLYYYLRPVASIQGGNDPQTDYAANGSNATWIKIEGMQWLFVEILLAQWAKLGSAIFDNNKLISQYGILNGAESAQYQEPGFDPNIELDFLNGKSKLNDVIIKGSSRSKFTYCPDSSKIDYSDNVAMISDNDGWIDVYYLPWDISQSGRQITIVNYKWGSNTSQGSEFIFAPSGKYFFEHGVNKDRIVVGSQAVQLLGYGDDSTFYGWIVLGRTDIKSTSLYGGVGKPVKFFAIGNVYGSGTDAGIDYQTYDGSTMSVSRLDVGKYKITFNSSWFSMPNMAFVIVSGIGYALNTTNPIKATVTIRQPSYITVETSDDESRNDGSFSFLITDLYTFDKWQ